MSSRDVRRGITRAGWNREHSGWYSIHFFLICVVIGLVTASWWAFLAALLVLGMLESTKLGGVVMLWVYTLPWVAFSGAIGAVIGGFPAACVFAILGGGMVYVTLESGREYFRDL